MTDEAGGKVAGYDWYPYGLEMATTAGQTAASRWKYTVHERDEQTGLDSMWARYKPAYGVRFLSPDRADDVGLGSPQSWNKYVYVRNNPLVFVDPTGKLTAEECSQVGGSYNSGDGTCLVNGVVLGPEGETVTVTAKPKPIVLIDVEKIFFDSISTKLPPLGGPVGVGGGAIGVAAVSGAVRRGLRDVCVAAVFYKLREASPLGRSKLIGFGGMAMAGVGADLSGQLGVDTYTGELFVTGDAHFLVGPALGVSTSPILSTSGGSASDFQGLAEDLTVGGGAGRGVVSVGGSVDFSTPDSSRVKESTYTTWNLELGVGVGGGAYAGKGITKGVSLFNVYSLCRLF